MMTLRVQKLCRWLEHTLLSNNDPSQTEDLPRLVIECYLQRSRLLLEPLRMLACQGGQRAAEFERLFIIFCKLGKHVTFTRKVMEATVHLHDDFREHVRVSSIPASPEKHFPLIKKEGTIEAILGRAFSSATERDEFRARLQTLWNTEEVSTILARERPSKTKVHAELLVADYFYRHNLQFLDGHDKYIGCSKRTCYLCEAYLRNHPGSFTMPSSHGKIYTSWRCPDVFQNDTNQLCLLQDKMWQEMISQVRKDLRREVESRSGRAGLPPDSTAGLTSENHPVFSPFASSKLESLLTCK